MQKFHKNKKKLISHADFFVLPHLVVKENHLSKKDIINIKNFVNQKMALIALITAIGVAILNSLVVLISVSSANGEIISMFGLAAFIGSFVTVGGCVISALFSVLGLVSNKNKNLFNRIAIDVLIFSLSADMLLSMFSDAQKGFVSVGLGVSPAIVLVIVLLILQQAFFADSIILTLLYSAGLIAITTICQQQYGLVSVHYYYIIAIIYPLAGHLVRSFLFYAETQRYCQILLNERLYNNASYDELTRCKNRYALKEHLEANTRRWIRDQVNLLIIIFDIDDFKLFNDTFTHSAGDYCLKSICDGIRSEFPSPDLDFFRYGGEEFLLIFEMQNVKDAFEIMEKVRRSALSLKIKTPEGATYEYVTVSVGGRVQKVNSGFDFETEMQKADSYLYQAKNEGKNLSCLNGKIIRK